MKGRKKEWQGGDVFRKEKAFIWTLVYLSDVTRGVTLNQVSQSSYYEGHVLGPSARDKLNEMNGCPQLESEVFSTKHCLLLQNTGL